MKHYDVEANSPEHQQKRLGVVTASQATRIMTPKTRRMSSQADGYRYYKIAERATGEPSEIESYQAPWMERGTGLEDEAVKRYELEQEVDTERGGFWTDDAGNVGCSPDRMVGATGILEIKCPLLPRQIETALHGIGDEYYPQIQVQLYVTEREWVDVYSYHPRLIIDPIRVYRDDKFIADFDELVKLFIGDMLRECAELEERFGKFPWPGVKVPRPVPLPTDPMGVSDADVAAIFAARHREQEEKSR